MLHAGPGGPGCSRATGCAWVVWLAPGRMEQDKLHGLRTGSRAAVSSRAAAGSRAAGWHQGRRAGSRAVGQALGPQSSYDCDPFLCSSTRHRQAGSRAQLDRPAQRTSNSGVERQVRDQLGAALLHSS